MLISCVAIDDAPWALALIKEYIQKMPALRLIGDFEDAIGAGEFLRAHLVDLLFLAIQMPGISGLTLAKSLEVKPKIIFTTAYKDFGWYYLLKPFGFERFCKAVQKVFFLIEAKDVKLPDKRDESIFVWSGYKLVKVVFSKILYIESRKDYVCFFIKEGKTLLSLMTLKELAEKLPENKFVRVHRSYIVPLTEILYMTSGMLGLVSGIQIPIGNPYKERIKLIFNK